MIWLWFWKCVVSVWTLLRHSSGIQPRLQMLRFFFFGGLKWTRYFVCWDGSVCFWMRLSCLLVRKQLLQCVNCAMTSIPTQRLKDTEGNGSGFTYICSWKRHTSVKSQNKIPNVAAIWIQFAFCLSRNMINMRVFSATCLRVKYRAPRVSHLSVSPEIPGPEHDSVEASGKQRRRVGMNVPF